MISMAHISSEAVSILQKRFARDSLIALATAEGDRPSVRTVDAYYEDGVFYVVTHALSGKVRQIAANPHVAVSGEWFTAHGIGENLGYVLLESNHSIMKTLRAAFAAWYGNGHVNEDDPNTCLLAIRLTDGILFADGVRYDLDFSK